MKKRRALLIGIPEYESDAITDLPVVNRDIETLHTALEKSGFVIRTVGVDGESQTGRNKVLRELRRECKEAKGVETLLLYFSGHGMHYGGKDYLIPSDAFLDDPEYIEEYLVSTDLGDIIDQSDAETIVFFIDACREGVRLGVKDTYLAGWSRGDRRKASQRSFVMVFACSSGQASQYVGTEDGFSLFTKALAEVLDPQHPACTLEDVLQATQEKLNQLIGTHQKQPQQIRRAFESAVEDDTFSRVICDGLVQAIESGRSSDPWSEAALQSSLWKDRGTDEDPTVKEFKQQVAQIVTACWQQWQTTIRVFPQDPWRDGELPLRVLNTLDLLVFRSDPPIELTLAETALVITVPFVREAVLANGVSHAAGADPLSWDCISSPVSCRAALEKEHQAQPRFIRKAQRLKDQGQLAEKDAVMAWLLHRCLLKTLAIWLPELEGGYLANHFYKALDHSNTRGPSLAKEALTRNRLLELARCMFADPERIDRDDRPDALQARTTVGQYREEQVVREKMLAYLLKLAGLLAIDTRMLSEVIVDHIGLSDPLTPEQVRHAVNQAHWNPAGRGRTLKVICEHPAIDWALGGYVEDADTTLNRILRQVTDGQRGMDALSGLPTHLLPDGITPEKQEGVPVYQTPHVNFQLAHDEVRELLMGEQLYGDPMLAIRELYQNALDACRYRKARLEYLKQTGQYEGADEDWEGRILFRQMTDDNGRVYVECEDNGIGMGILHLSQCFARAGRRFADLPEFIEEQADWLKCDPPIRLYPNSQFGVGVLSYFMLADEIEVETCRLDRTGKPGQKLRVRIPGSSGLFRVRTMGFGKSAGTRVRLYLNRLSHKGKLVSCIEILKQLLWVAEFPTEVQQGIRCEVWQPGQLKHPLLKKDQYISAEENVWWTSERPYSDQGCILADGLWTEETQPGVIINLRGTRYPKLTVNRKKIVDWDQEWGFDILIQNSKYLVEWSHLTFIWLWSFGWRYPQVTEHILALLNSKNSSLKLGRWNGDSAEVPINRVSYFQADELLIEGRYQPESHARSIPWWIFPHRVTTWIHYALIRKSIKTFENLSLLPQPELCSLPEPRDAIALSRNLKLKNSKDHFFTGRVPIAHIVLISTKLKESIALTLKRLQKYTPLGLEVSLIDPDVLEIISLTQEDLDILLDNDFNNENYSSYSYELKYDKVSPAYLLLSAARLNEPIAVTLQRFQKLAPLGLEVPEVETTALSSFNINQEDLIVLSRMFDGQNALNSNYIPLPQLILAAAKINESLANIFQRFQRFCSLGLEVPEIKNLELLENISITQEDVVILSEDLDERNAWYSDHITISHLILASNKLREPVIITLQRLQRFIPLGLEIPKIEDFRALENYTVTQEDITVLSRNANGEGGLYEDLVPPLHIFQAAIKLNEPISKILERLEKFVPLGLKLPEIDLDALGDFTPTREDLIPFTEDFDGTRPFLEGGIHPSRIFTAAYILGESIPTTLERMRRLAPLLGVTLPEGKPDTWKYCNYEED